MLCPITPRRLLVLSCFGLSLIAAPPPAKLWILSPLTRPGVPAAVTKSTNPIDAFIAAKYQSKKLKPIGQVDKRTLLRRVYLDLIGIPPTPGEQEAFLNDTSPGAYEKVVDKLLADEQHGVRYGRHWLDVLRYADADERMTAAPGIHLWRDWVVNALNSDMPYDQFVRTQLTGYRTTNRTQMSSTGVRSPLEPRPEDMFALGFLARGDVVRDGKNTQEMPIVAVETVSTAFMGLTVGCAKCHDHMYDPIKQKDFYAMKALFDPLVIRKVTLATPAEIVAKGKEQEEAERKRAPLEKALADFVEPYRIKLYNDRVAMLPPDVKAIILKPEQERTRAQQKIADDYFPVLRIDSDKINEAVPEADRAKYKELQRAVQQAGGGGFRGGNGLPAFWTVEPDAKRQTETSYILTSGDPERPEQAHPVEPGWPFMPANVNFHEGRIAAFSDWLTSSENQIFPRVAVNRLWQWHFGEGIQKLSSDFGKLGGTPSDPELLDWLASEFVKRNFSMKQIHRLMVTSDTYKLASEANGPAIAANIKVDPEDTYLWRFRLQRLEAEPIWDSILTAAGDLDTTLGGASFDPSPAPMGRRGPPRGAQAVASKNNRRAAYMVRGYSTSRDVVPNFLQSFDVDDGRAPCPIRTQTVTAPQALFLMNSPEIEKESTKLAERMQKESGGDLKAAVERGFQLTTGRPPSASERDHALTYLENDPARLKGLAWLLFNLDEFIYVK
ncbi:MAG: DUF1549 and DUF1553 domain-containing protein [Acidobacteriota bacterium]|nr:DUF1549 and DUF1553 domain-containing protein [Acidobacteriota bacterium]